MLTIWWSDDYENRIEDFDTGRDHRCREEGPLHVLELPVVHGLQQVEQFDSREERCQLEFSITYMLYMQIPTMMYVLMRGSDDVK